MPKKIRLLLVLATCLLVIPVYAPPIVEDPPCFPPEECVPVDGGLLLVLGAGAAMAYRQIRNKSESSPNDVNS